MKNAFQRTHRWKNRLLVYHDWNRARYVVSRRADGIERKTSVRYGGPRLMADAAILAVQIACRLKRCPVRRLKAFRFTRI